MKFSIRYAEQIVGALVVLALAILVVVVLMLGRNQRWFARDYEYVTFLDSAAGVSVNMAITYRGFTMGNVRRITLTQDNRVEVRFTIFEENNDRVRVGSIVELNAAPIPMIPSSFLFHPGLGDELLSEGATIPEIRSQAARDLIAAGLASAPESADSISNIINHVESILETVSISIAGNRDYEDLPELGRLLRTVNVSLTHVSDVLESVTGQIEPLLLFLTNAIENLIDDVMGIVLTYLDIEGPVFSSLTEVLDSIVGMASSVEETIDFIPAQMPQISLMLSTLHGTLIEAERLIIALTNNPLLRGGVPELRETGPGAATPRDLEF